jgi:hypothetical protein
MVCVTTAGMSPRQRLAIWDLYRLRQALARMDLDWDLPAAKPVPPDRHPVQVTVDLGEFGASAAVPDAAGVGITTDGAE